MYISWYNNFYLFLQNIIEQACSLGFMVFIMYTLGLRWSNKLIRVTFPLIGMCILDLMYKVWWHVPLLNEYCDVRPIAFFLISLVFMKGKVVQKAIFSLLIYEIVIVCATLDSAIFSAVTGTWSTFAFKSHGYDYLLFRALNMIVINLTLFVFCYFVKKTNTLNSRTGSVSFLAVSVLSMVIIQYFNSISDYMLDSITRTILVACVVLLNILVHYISTKISNSERIAVSIQQKYDYQQRYMHDVNEMDEKLRHIRHDMKNHLQCAVSLIADAKNDSAIDYLVQLTDFVSISLSHTYIVDNAAINSVLDSKFSCCKSDGIAFDYSITGDITKIKDVDLNIILSNLLDNAIEGCTGCDDRRINLKICNEKSYLKVSVSNTIARSVLEQNPNLHSTKSNDGNHGIGIKSIEAIVQRYNGLIDFYENNNRFIANVLLQIEKRGCDETQPKKASPKRYESSANGLAFWYN